ncbi:hypothetical protein H9X96_20660 [Pedobacter sp. N36a]|uniref:hypothetical protein n=1 Tax=Pedobacter sp. N36a TaxID=2767996 RepID=UPI0016575E40|nr:hypothetical protein [Pedobacter sp. N36a]MBC8988173.1 hypothetical protein [Pedobacter sp. N36a]
MPKIRCKCDNVIWLGEIPSPHQWLIISDVEYDKFEGQIDPEILYSKMEIVVRCNVCDRLHVFWDGFDKPQTIYIKEAD